MTCNIELLSLCNVPKVVSREGHGGAHSSLNLPFYGLYFFSGETFHPVGDTAPQNPRMVDFGVHMADTGRTGCGC